MRRQTFARTTLALLLSATLLPACSDASFGSSGAAASSHGNGANGGNATTGPTSADALPHPGSVNSTANGQQDAAVTPAVKPSSQQSTTTATSSSTALPGGATGPGTGTDTSPMLGTDTSTQVTAATPACVNHLKQGLVDPRNGNHYKWVGYLPACQGYAACAALAPGAQVIYDNLDMPDEVEACDVDFGYWYQNYQGEFAQDCTLSGQQIPDGSGGGGNAGLALDIVVGGGTDSPLSSPGDIICVY